MKTPNLPIKGEIYARPKHTDKLRLFHLHYKPKYILRSAGIVTAGLALLVGGLFLVPTQKAEKQLADTPTTITTTDTTTQGNNRNGNCFNSDYRGYNNCNPGNVGNPDNPVYIPPIQLIGTNPTPYPGFNGNGQNGNVTGISSQISATQQQIGAQMQACANNARQMANQIIALKNQQLQYQRQIDNFNDQIWRIDTGTPAGQQRRDAMDRQIQQMQTQMDTMNTNISRAQDNYNTSNDRCRQNIDTLVQQREDLEGRLNDAFNQSLDIQIPY